MCYNHERKSSFLGYNVDRLDIITEEIRGEYCGKQQNNNYVYCVIKLWINNIINMTNITITTDAFCLYICNELVTKLS